jgi:biopolymer transport protein TolR
MGHPAHDHGGIIAGINVTPLVDVTLVLLVVFIVTAKMIVTPAVPLELPRASQSEPVQVVFSVAVPATGPTLVNGLPAASDHDLVRLARAALAGAPDLRAVIDADGAVPHRRVIHTLDLIRRAGITRIAFGALPAEEGAR